MMNKWVDDIKQKATKAGEAVTLEWVQQAQQQIPYCVLPMLLYLKRYGVSGHEDLLERLAISFPDRRALAMQLGEESRRWSHFYPSEPIANPDTETTIERFLDNYGHSSPQEVEAINRAIFNPMPDYADVLAAQEQSEGNGPLSRSATDSQDQVLDKFIAESLQWGEQAATEPASSVVEEPEKAEIAQETIADPSIADDSMLTESLAKMYITRHKYSQALEIIERLNLKYPEKSIYFADQIRFLRKLVLNETINYKK